MHIGRISIAKRWQHVAPCVSTGILSPRTTAAAKLRQRFPSSYHDYPHLTACCRAPRVIAVAASRLPTGCLPRFCGLTPTAKRCRRLATENQTKTYARKSTPQPEICQGLNSPPSPSPIHASPFTQAELAQRHDLEMQLEDLRQRRGKIIPQRTHLRRRARTP